ncbi:MAG: glycosyltransferase family 39 protein, partial [Chloroflexota bacterium]
MTVEEVDISAREEKPVALTGQHEGQTTNIAQRVLTRENAVLVGLVFVLVLAAYFRFTGLDWDGNHHLHPDERFLTEIASRLQPVDDPLAYLRTSESTLNPYNIDKSFYVYGNFPMTVIVYASNWLQQLCRATVDLCSYNYAGYDGVHLVGRFFSGFVDLISVLFIFLIGRRLYGWRAGLLGALLLGIAVMPIQQSHFFTMDNWAAALCTVALYGAVRASEDARHKRWWLLFGLFLGLAVSSRINVAPLAAIAPIAGVIWLARREQQAAPGLGWRYINTERGNVDLQRVILGVLLAAVMSLTTFRLAQPYAFMDAEMVRQTVQAETGRQPSSIRVAMQSIVGFNPNWISNMQEIQAQQSPEAAHPPALQWTARAPILFPLSNMVLYGMGLSAGIAAVVGFLWALWRTLRAHPQWIAHAIPVAWAGAYFLFMGTRWVKS